MNPPRHVLVIMDAEPPATPVEEIIARLPDFGEASPATPQILRLERVEPGQRDRTSDMTRLAVAVADLAARVREALHGAVQAELYLCGQAPLPLFVQLGQALSDWTGPITFFDRRADLAWDEVQLAPLPPEENPAFLDVVSGLDADLTASSRPVVFLSSRGVAPDAAALSALFKALGEELGPVVQARTSAFRPLRSADVAQAGRRLRQIVGALPTAKAPLLLLRGTPALAFLLGRTLGEREALVATGADDVLKVPVVLKTSDVARPRIQVFIAHAEVRSEEPQLHRELAHHIKACMDPQGLQIDVVDRNSVPAGADEKKALDALLKESDLIVPLLSADLIESPLGQAVTRLYGRGHLMIPVRERAFAVHLTAWKNTLLLPRGGAVLRSTGAQDTLLSDIASEVWLRAKEIAEERARRDRDRWRAPQSSRPASTSAPHAQVLAEIERDLEAEPLLRFTRSKREGIWLRLVAYLDQAHPEKKLKALLRAPTREQFAQLWQPSTEMVEPETFLPSEPFGPLNVVLELLGEDAAAHWLYLGVVFVCPVLPFPHGSFQHWAVNLAERLRPYLPRLETRAPAARRRLALAERLHRENCPGLLAVLVNGHQAPDEEIDLAVEILKHLRDHAPLRETLPDLAGLQSPALLNLLGAYAQWCGDNPRARDAYHAARDRAFTDRDLIAEWVAVQGLRVSMSADGWTSYQEHEMQRLWQHKRDLEVRSPLVQRLEERAKHTLRQVPRELAGRLCVNLAHDRPTQGPAIGVADHDLDELLQDEEELGLPPLRCRAAAELLGTIRLLQGGDQLAQAIEVLCRYGSSGLGVTLEKLQFFSPELRPEHPGFAAIVRQVLTAGRTASEWSAKLDFLQRYLLDLPLDLTAQARVFYGGALQCFLHEAPRRGEEQWISHVTDSTAPWALVGTVVEQLIYLSGLTPLGADWLLDVLNHPEPVCWQRALECLGLFSTDYPLGPEENLNALGRRVQQLLEEPESCGLFAGAPGGPRGFLRDHFIPPGLAHLLVLLSNAGADRSLVDKLHQKLCGMLRHLLGQRREGMSALYQRSFFSEEVFGWLSARDDAESQTLIGEQLHLLLDDLDWFSTRSAYFDRFGFFSRRVFAQLSMDDRRRLVRILEQHTEELLRAVFEREYAARPMAWFAAAALAQDDAALWAPAREILAHSQPLPDLLAAVLSVPVARMGSLAASAEQALLHCLSGNTFDSMPWFDRARQRQATLDEESLLTAGLQGVYSYLDVNAAQEPAARWSAWLDPVLAQSYHKAPAVAVAALHALRLALTRVPAAVDQVRAAHALSWALAQPDREVRDAALEAALLHRVLLDRAAPGGRLAAALRRYAPPQTVSAAAVWRRSKG